MGHVRILPIAFSVLVGTGCIAASADAAPPGIAKKSAPSRIVRELPTYPDYEWKRCGTDLVLVEGATRIVAEVLASIFK